MLIFKIVSICIGKYRAVLIFSIKYDLVYANLNKILKFCTLIYFFDIQNGTNPVYRYVNPVRLIVVKKRYSRQYEINNFDIYSMSFMGSQDNIKIYGWVHLS